MHHDGDSFRVFEITFKDQNLFINTMNDGGGRVTILEFLEIVYPLQIGASISTILNGEAPQLATLIK